MSSRISSVGYDHAIQPLPDGRSVDPFRWRNLRVVPHLDRVDGSDDLSSPPPSPVSSVSSSVFEKGDTNPEFMIDLFRGFQITFGGPPSGTEHDILSRLPSARLFPTSGHSSPRPQKRRADDEDGFEAIRFPIDPRDPLGVLHSEEEDDSVSSRCFSNPRFVSPLFPENPSFQPFESKTPGIVPEKRRGGEDGDDFSGKRRKGEES